MKKKINVVICTNVLQDWDTLRNCGYDISNGIMVTSDRQAERFQRFADQFFQNTNQFLHGIEPTQDESFEYHGNGVFPFGATAAVLHKHIEDNPDYTFRFLWDLKPNDRHNMQRVREAFPQVINVFPYIFRANL